MWQRHPGVLLWQLHPEFPGFPGSGAVVWDELRGRCVSKHELAPLLGARENMSETRRGTCRHCEDSRLPD